MRRSSKAWIALGVVISIVWALAAWHYESYSQLESAESFAALSYKNCTNNKLLKHEADMTSCEQARSADVQKWLAMGDYTQSNLFAALVPIPFIWLAGFILIYLGRIQMAGFNEVIGWNGSGTFKRLVVVFCGLCVVVAILIGVLSLLVLRTDNKAPVGLDSFVDVNGNSQYASAAGTWVRTDLTDDTIANPIQKSKIECYRNQGRCIQATAYVMDGKSLGVDIETFTIQQWTPSAVIYADEGLCSTTIYTIDLGTHVVSGAGHLTNQGDLSCKMNFKSKEQWSLLLSNGFNVYWRLHQAARPWLLRVLQALL